MLPRRFRRELLPVLTLGFILWSPLDASAGDRLREALGKLAANVAKALEKDGVKAITVGTFAGPKRFAANAGPGIAHELSHELKKLDVQVVGRAEHELNGDYTIGIDKETRREILKINAKLVDRFGEAIHFPITIPDPDEIINAAGGTQEPDPPKPFPPPGPGGATAFGFGGGIIDPGPILPKLENPRLHLRGTRVFPSSTSQLGLEVLIVSGASLVPRQPLVSLGLAFVQIRRGEVYRVRLVNDSAGEMAAELHIDGLSMFSFSEVTQPSTGYSRYKQVFVDPRSTMTIPGWFRTLEKSNEFVITKYDQTAVAELGASQESIGVITARFARSWNKGTEPPADEFPRLTVDQLRSLVQRTEQSADRMQLLRVYTGFSGLPREEQYRLAQDQVIRAKLRQLLDAIGDQRLVSKAGAASAIIALESPKPATRDKASVSPSTGPKFSNTSGPPTGSTPGTPSTPPTSSGGDTAAGASPDGTGRGKEVKGQYSVVEERLIGRTRAFVSIRYSRDGK